jgi:hypothetical protein
MDGYEKYESQLGWWHSQTNIFQMFQTTNQYHGHL